MSDAMLLGVLRMPMPDNPDAMTLCQFVGRARQAADRIEADAAKIERLRAALKTANDQTEHFEREWYLRGDEIERLRAVVVDVTADAKIVAAAERERWASEIDRLRLKLAASCDEHRSEAYDTTTGGGCVLLRDAVAEDRERWAKRADEYATWGGSNFCAWFKKLAAEIRA
jgi:hypothetical protein